MLMTLDNTRERYGTRVGQGEDRTERKRSVTVTEGRINRRRGRRRGRNEEYEGRKSRLLD